MVFVFNIYFGIHTTLFVVLSKYIFPKIMWLYQNNKLVSTANIDGDVTNKYIFAT